MFVSLTTMRKKMFAQKLIFMQSYNIDSSNMQFFSFALKRKYRLVDKNTNAAMTMKKKWKREAWMESMRIEVVIVAKIRRRLLLVPMSHDVYNGVVEGWLFPTWNPSPLQHVEKVRCLAKTSIRSNIDRSG